MSSSDLSKRNSKWVQEARDIGDAGENNIENILKNGLPKEYKILSKPNDLSKIYGSYGVIPDLCVYHENSDKRLYIEKKTGNNGGNAHERAYKYLSPILKQKTKERFNTLEEPFFFVFSGNTFAKDKYKQEIALLLGHIPNNYFILENDGQASLLCDMIKKLFGE